MASQPSRRMHTGIFSQESSLIISEESAVRMLCFTESPGIPTMKHVRNKRDPADVWGMQRGVPARSTKCHEDNRKKTVHLAY